jgi:lipid-A-disaccharide synthase-like uncharacterized protein
MKQITPILGTTALVALVAMCQPAWAQQTTSGPDDVTAMKQRISQQEQKIQDLQRQLGPVATPGSPAVTGTTWETMRSKLDRLLPRTTGGWLWFIVGFGGEFVFFLRFVVQWWASERAKRTVVPMVFWHLSLAGTALVLAYAVQRIDPVFILAYSLNIFLYVRNMMIARRDPAVAMVMEKESE